MNVRSSNRGGFTLWELLVALSMMATVLGVSGELFRSTVMMSARSNAASSQSFQIDSAIERMRHDAWACREISVIDPHHVGLISDGTNLVAWSIDKDGNVTRNDGNSQQRWLLVGADWSLAADGPCLTISDKDHQGSQAQRLASATAFFAEVKP